MPGNGAISSFIGVCFFRPPMKPVSSETREMKPQRKFVQMTKLASFIVKPSHETGLSVSSFIPPLGDELMKLRETELPKGSKS